MKKGIFTLVIFCMIVFASQGQAVKTVFFELGGPGLASFNFDTRFGPRPDGFGGRVGVGGFYIDNEGVIFFPVSVNYLIGKDSKNYFEIGGGVTPMVASESFSSGDGNFTTTFGHLLFGYRLQPPDGGFTFRAFISPVFGDGFFIPYYGGVSFGYAFGGRKK